VSEYDPSKQIVDSTSTFLTRDLIGLFIGIVSVVLVILTVTICKWSRCFHLNENQSHPHEAEGLTSVTSVSSSNVQSRNKNQRIPSSDYGYSSTKSTKDSVLAKYQSSLNAQPISDTKVPRVTITALTVPSNTQLVPRLSLSPQASGSSISHSSYSIQQ